MVIQELQPSDIYLFTHLKRRIFHESNFMLLTYEELDTSIKTQKKLFFDIKKNGGNIFVAKEAHQLTGYACVIRNNAKKKYHCAEIGVGVRADFKRRGIARNLLTSLEVWASNNKIQRLEISVQAQNNMAISLYKKLEYKVEGIKKGGYLVNGKHIDDLLMCKIVTPNFNLN